MNFRFENNTQTPTIHSYVLQFIFKMTVTNALPLLGNDVFIFQSIVP